MFFICGVEPRQKSFAYNKVYICDRCGQYGRYEVLLSYMCLTLFFIPVLKWNKKFYIKSTCCKVLYELDPAIGQAIAKGHEVEIRQEHLRQVQGQSYDYQKRCSQCGFVAEHSFQYCPNCGKKFE